jgi:hypothetical protein
MACAEFTTPDGLFQILSRRFVDEEQNQVTEKRVITQYKYVSLPSGMVYDLKLIQYIDDHLLLAKRELPNPQS